MTGDVLAKAVSSIQMSSTNPLKTKVYVRDVYIDESEWI